MKPLKEKVAVVILNYNGKHFLEKFLPSVIQYSPGASIVVADNGSGDGSKEFVKRVYPQIRLIEFTQNEGFCRGYNLALQQIESEYYVLLNSDVEVSENWLSSVLTWMDQQPEVAVCQPKLLNYYQKNTFEYAGAAGGLIDYLGYPFCRGRIFETMEEDTGQYNDICEVFWASGACMIVRSEIYHQLGGLDEEFFAHMEEIDFCWRIKNAGYKVYYYGFAQVYHVGGGTLHKSNPRKTYLNFHNNLALLCKNLQRHHLLFALFCKILLDWVAALRFLLLGYPKDSLAIFHAQFNFFSRIWHWKLKRKKFELKASHPEILKKSIVLHYFLWGKKTYKMIKKD